MPAEPHHRPCASKGSTRRSARSRRAEVWDGEEFVDKNVGYPLEFDNTRSREELGIAFRDIADAVADQFQQMIDDGITHRSAAEPGAGH